MINYLIDVSWILYKGFYACSKIWADYPELHYLCKKIESLLSRNDACVYLCLDGYNTKGRRLLGDAYKAGRDRSGQRSVYEGLSSFIHLLKNDRIKIYYNKDYESDEIIFTLSRQLDGRNKIISGDKDLFQALTPNVVIDNGKSSIITNESYKFEYADKFFEVEPDRLPIFRAITGDASDTLFPPVKRFPHKLAANIASVIEYDGSCPTIENLKSVSKEYTASEIKWIDKLILSYDSFKMNFDIMKLNVITDKLVGNDYSYQLIELGDFLKSKIERLNTL